VVGNPCNTNCLIAKSNAGDVPADRWFAMTRLDENRAKTQLALKAGGHVSEVKKLAIWGNHSSTMYPDFTNAEISGRPVPEVITDKAWFVDDFIPTVQQRGAAIIKARGASSAASAANAAIDTVRSLTNPTPDDDVFSVAVCSDGSYGIEKGLMYSYPMRSDGSNWQIVQDLPINEFSQAKLTETENELKEEKSMVADLLG
jgi:malate dehydrogenase